MSLDNLGKVYADGECVVREGDEGSTMFVVLSGHLQVLGNQDGSEVPLAVLEAGDIFGEMALFEKARRSSSVRAQGDARVMTLDKRTLLRRIKEDPLVALNLLEMLCHRIRHLNGEYAALRTSLEANA